MRRCANKTNLKDIERALQLRALVTEATLRSDDDDDVSPQSPLMVSNAKSITLPDCLWSVCCFLPHLKNCFVTSEQQQQGVRLSTLLFQKVANMEYYLLDALDLPEELDQFEQIFFPTDWKAKYERGKVLF